MLLTCFLYSEPVTVGSKDPKYLTEAWNYCKKWSKGIEVLYHNEEDQKVLAKVHFRYYPAVSITLHNSVNVCNKG